MKKVRWLTPTEERAWRGYRRMRTLLDLRISRDMAGDSGLSEADYDVLSTLTEGDGSPWRANELAARLLWSTSRLAHQVGRMERRGLVARQVYEGDRRGALINLTDVGLATLKTVAPSHVESVRRHLIDLLTPAEIDTLALISQKVIERLTAAYARDEVPGSD
ncbi:MAG: MarR family winged helix-turn-helix transcriptional regulator [Acidimicrobiia bacterium]